MLFFLPFHVERVDEMYLRIHYCTNIHTHIHHINARAPVLYTVYVKTKRYASSDETRNRWCPRRTAAGWIHDIIVISYTLRHNIGNATTTCIIVLQHRYNIMFSPRRENVFLRAHVDDHDTTLPNNNSRSLIVKVSRGGWRNVFFFTTPPILVCGDAEKLCARARSQLVDTTRRYAPN